MAKQQFYDVVLIGTGIFFENGTERPIVGFVTCRRLHVSNQADAERQAKHTVLIDWNHTLNADRKLGVPTLKIHQTRRINRWFTRKPPSDYFFFDGDDTKEQHLARLKK